MNRVRLQRVAWFSAALVPLWSLWVFSWFTLKGIEGWVGRAPRHFGIHLYKQRMQGELELFSRVVDLFESGGSRSPLEYLTAAYERGDIDRMAALFGLSAPVMVFEREGFEVRYPARPSGPPLAVLLEDPSTRDALTAAVRRMVEHGEKEAVFSLPEGGEQDAEAPGAHWHLIAAHSGGDLVCVLVLPGGALERSGDVLQAAGESRLRESLRRYLIVTLPVLALCSFWILLIAARGSPTGPDREKGCRT